MSIMMLRYNGAFVRGVSTWLVQVDLRAQGSSKIEGDEVKEERPVW